MRRSYLIITVSLLTSLVLLAYFSAEDLLMIRVFKEEDDSSSPLLNASDTNPPSHLACPTPPTNAPTTAPTSAPTTAPTGAPTSPPTSATPAPCIVPTPPPITYKSYPYKVVPRGKPTKPLKILFWSTNSFYNSMMDRWWFHHLLSVKDMPDYYEATLWGHEFEGYDNSLNMAQNIKKKYGSEDYFDVSYTLWNTIGLAEVMDPYALNVFYEHESYSDRNKAYFEQHKTKVMMYTYQQSLQEYFYQKDALIVHTPHSVRLEIMDDITCPDEPEWDLILAGTGHKLRQKYREWISNNQFTGVKATIYNHPGYTEQQSMAQVNAMGLNAEKVEEQVKKFLESICTAKICMTSTVNPPDTAYSVRKYMEFASVGCMVVADVPFDRMEEFRPLISEIDPIRMNLNTELNRLQYLLAHPEVMQHKIDIARAHVESRYQIAHTFEIAYEAFRMREKHKWTGLIYPFGCDTMYPAEAALIRMNESVVYFPCHQEAQEPLTQLRCPDPMERTPYGCECGEKCRAFCHGCGATSEFQCGEFLHCAFTGRRTCLNQCKGVTPFEAIQIHFKENQPAEKDIVECAAKMIKLDVKLLNTTNSVNGAEAEYVEIFMAPEALTAERPSMEYLVDELIGAINTDHKMCSFEPRVWARVITKFSVP